MIFADQGEKSLVGDIPISVYEGVSEVKKGFQLIGESFRENPFFSGSEDGFHVPSCQFTKMFGKNMLERIGHGLGDFD